MPMKPPVNRPLRKTPAPKPRSTAPSMWKPKPAVGTTPRPRSVTAKPLNAPLNSPPPNSTIYSLPNSAPGFGMAYAADGTPLGSIKLPNAVAAGKGLHYDAQGRLSIVDGTAPAGGPRSIAAPTPSSLIAPNVGGAMYGPPKPAAAPNPWDGAFFGEIASQMAATAATRAAAQLAGTRETTDYEIAQQRAKRDLMASLLSADYGANKSGLLHSGHLGKVRGGIETDAGERAADADTSYRRNQADRETGLNTVGSIVAAPGTILGYSGTGQAFNSFLDSAFESITRTINANPERAVEFEPYLAAIQAARPKA